VKFYKLYSSLLAVSLLSATLLGCSANGGSNSQASDKANGDVGTKPAASNPFDSITWKNEKVVIFNWSGMQDGKFIQIVEDPLKKKFPELDLTHVNNGKGSSLDELIAAGDVPDIIFGGARAIPDYVETHFSEDLGPWVKKFNMDLSRIVPGMVDYSKKYSNGQLMAMPYLRNTFVLYYNKDIFDKFGVPYPKDGMTWSEAKQLAARVSRTDGGVEFHGIGMNSRMILDNQLSLSYIDPKTGKASVNNASWAKLLTNFAELFKIPGNTKGIYNSTFAVEKI
jgi:multiple sugar transport system substrate-binding protein